ncbi:MAG: 3-deoxy-manno-octulosonate cytidylyltransferase [Candidatus Omnitrophica bacterium]|nr:3-deoxy-manno-octulosonate cytidylyltransferase [Candidatus Omnitrophota bacterium]
MEAIGIIPARFASTRFEGKLIKPLLGKPVIQHVWENAMKSTTLDDLIIACDDERIFNIAKDFGAKVTLTAKEHLSGTDRITEIANPIEVKVVVNIQADEPFIQPSMIDEVTSALLQEPKLNMTTLRKRITTPEEASDPNVVKVIVDKNEFAIYFSRSMIPCPKEYSMKGQTISKEFLKHNAYFKHIGLYAYTKDFIFTFKNLPQGNLEKLEGLEQLRAIENGYRVKVFETRYETIGIDTPEDLKRAEEFLLRSEKEVK